MLEADYSYYAILVAGLLPYCFTVIAKAGRMKLADNQDPRAFLEALDGYRRRADFSQKNSFESFPLFAAGVLVAHQGGGELNLYWLNVLCVSYLVFRVLYGAAYLGDRPYLRSLFWAGGFASSIALFWV